MIAEETGGRFMEPYLHRLRCDQQQSARSYELLASLSLAKLYQSTGRLVEAHAILAHALEGTGNARNRRGAGAARQAF
jgi:hypothetical protein